MKTITYLNAEARKNPHGVDARGLYDSKHAMVTHMYIKPGEQLKKHITPVDVIFYVLEGTGIIEIGDEKKEVSKDTLIDSPAKIPHCWYNKSDSVLRVLVIKVPKPEGKTKIL
ncbi:MAG TPA: cupin domain-containing protein [Bacteroidales bacterium]|nr:cupin domain-containing protein [Bacteroidales bacterium]